MPSPKDTLVRYDPPIVITDKVGGSALDPKASKKKLKVTLKKGGGKLPPVDSSKPNSQVEDILNSIIPPR